MNTTEEEYVGSKTTTIKKERYIAACIAGTEFLIGLLLSGMIAVILILFMSFDEMVKFFTGSSFLLLCVVFVIVIISQGVGVRYIVQKHLLKTTHDSKRIATWLLIFNIVVYAKTADEMLVRATIAAILSTFIVYKFLAAEHKKLLQPSVSSPKTP
jgi:hypothetical protein